MKNKIVLVNSNIAWDGRSMLGEMVSAIPILTALLKADFDFEVIDANGKNMTKEELVEVIKRAEAEVVLITALTVHWYAYYHETARLAKMALPSCKVLMGGVLSDCMW